MTLVDQKTRWTDQPAPQDAVAGLEVVGPMWGRVLPPGSILITPATSPFWRLSTGSQKRRRLSCEASCTESVNACQAQASAKRIFSSIRRVGRPTTLG